MSSDSEQSHTRSVQYTPEFKRNIRQLARKYRRIQADIQPLLDVLGQGQTPGDQVPGIPYVVFKVRARNSDSGKGKSGGYRIIYQQTEDGKIILVTIYSKTEQEDIGLQDVRQIILDYGTQALAYEEGREEESMPDSASTAS